MKCFRINGLEGPINNGTEESRLCEPRCSEITQPLHTRWPPRDAKLFARRRNRDGLIFFKVVRVTNCMPHISRNRETIISSMSGVKKVLLICNIYLFCNYFSLIISIIKKKYAIPKLYRGIKKKTRFRSQIKIYNTAGYLIERIIPTGLLQIIHSRFYEVVFISLLSSPRRYFVLGKIKN